MSRSNKTGMQKISVEQVKAARMLLGWDQSQLAAAASVGIATVKRLEIGTGPLSSTPRITAMIKLAFEQACIEFLGTPDKHPGVRLNLEKSTPESQA